MDATEFWRGSFGTEYTQRNRVNVLQRVPFWSAMLGITQARSVLEVGCNAGWNLRAMRSVDSKLDLVGVDLNRDALAEAEAAGLDVHQMNGSEVADVWPQHFDLVFTAGVLIHVPTEDLGAVMRSIADASKRYVIAVEYAASREEAVEYRGHTDRLWRRPFGALYEDAGLKIIATGPLPKAQGFDDCHYWLLTK